MATIYSQTLTANDGPWADYSLRSIVRVTAGALDQIRVTLTGNDANISRYDNVSIAISNETNDDLGTHALLTASATPVELKWSGVSGVVIPAGGTSPPSDWLNFTGFTASNFLLVTLDIASSDAFTRYLSGLGVFGDGGLGFMSFQGATNGYLNPSGTIYNSGGLGGRIEGVSLIETRSVATGIPKIIGGQLLHSPLLDGRLIR